MQAWREFSKGLVAENPVLVQLLGVCATVAVTTSLKNGFGMGVATTFVLICANFLISCLRHHIPKEIRNPIYIVVIATFVTVVKLVMSAWFPALKEELGIFLALIVVNCILLARAECFASKNSPFVSAIDGLGMGVGFTFALCLMGLIREFFGNASVLGIPIMSGLETYTQKIFILSPGGFLTFGLIIFFATWLKMRKDKRQAIRLNLIRGRRRREEEMLAGVEVMAAYRSTPSSLSK